MRASNDIILFLAFLFNSICLSMKTLFYKLGLDSLANILSNVCIKKFRVKVPFVFFKLTVQGASGPTLVGRLYCLSPFVSLFFVSIILNRRVIFAACVKLIVVILKVIFGRCFMGDSGRTGVIR